MKRHRSKVDSVRRGGDRITREKRVWNSNYIPTYLQLWVTNYTVGQGENTGELIPVQAAAVHGPTISSWCSGAGISCMPQGYVVEGEGRIYTQPGYVAAVRVTMPGLCSRGLGNQLCVIICVTLPLCLYLSFILFPLVFYSFSGCLCAFSTVTLSHPLSLHISVSPFPFKGTMCRELVWGSLILPDGNSRQTNALVHD